jgi:hypothetical protein
MEALVNSPAAALLVLAVIALIALWVVFGP